MKRLLGLPILCCLPLILAALPSGEEIHRGEVRFERRDGHFEIHASDGSIIHFRNFDLSRNEIVRFIQPSGSSRVLNRIMSATPSQIDGQIRANGHVYLVNPVGIVFGPNSVIDAGRLFAGAARISDEDFIAKRNAFTEIQGEIVNQGILRGEEIHLIGSKVENQGQIETKNGYVTILSGNSVIVGEREGHCFVLMDQDSPKGIGASDLIGLAIKNTGSIAAKDVHLEGDKLQIEGEILANNGTVQILGDTITLKSLKIDASGEKGGGTVLVGGDFQGQGSLRQSQFTHVHEDVLIDVSATELGNGGNAVLWSNGYTVFDGAVRACGGPKGGNGGLVETSGKLSLGSEKGRVDASASQGKMGDWLLDPLSIVIDTVGAGTLVQAANCVDVVTALSISNTTINGAVANVLLCASTTISQMSTAPINITSPGVGITFQAGSSTVLGASVATNNGNIIATTSGSSIASGSTISSGSGNVTFAALSTTGVGGTATIQTTSGTITTSNITLNTNISLVTGGGNIITNAITGALLNATINASSTGIVSLGGNVNVNTLTITNSLNTTIVGSTTANSVVLTNSTGTIDLAGTVTIGSITTTANGYATLFETGGTVTNAAIFYNTGGVQFGIAPAFNITFTGGLNTNQPGVTTSTFGTINTTATPMTLGPVVLLGNTTMNTSNGALTFNSTLTGVRNLTVNTGTTAPLFTGAVSIGDLVGNTSLAINTTGTNTIFSNTLTTVGGLTSTNNVVFNNNVSIGGVVTLPSLTTDVVPLANYNIAFLGGGTVTAFTQFFNTGTVTFGSGSLPTLTFPNGVNTIPGPSSTIVQGTVQVTGAGIPLMFGSCVFNTGNSFLTTNNGAMTIGNTTLTGNATLQTGGANLIVGNVSGAGNLTTNSGTTGTTTIASLNCGVFTPSNSLSVTVTGSTTAATVNLGGMANSQTVVFNGLVSISSGFFTSPSSYSVTFNAGGTVTPLTNFFNTGGVHFGNSSVSAIAFTNGVNTNFAGVATSTFGAVTATSGPITFGPLTLVGNTIVQDVSNPITFASTVNGGYSLTVIDAGGAVNFSGVVGGVTPLYSITASGAPVNISANMTASGGAIRFESPVSLLGPIVVNDTGGGISFTSTINGYFGLTLNALSSGNIIVSGAVGGTTALASLTVNAAGQASFASSISTAGTAGANGGNISISAGSHVGCGGNITAVGGANGFDGGNVTVSSGGSITVASIDVSGGPGGIFIGGNAGSISMQPASGHSSSKKLGNLPAGILVINGSLTAMGGSGTASGTAGTISLSPAGRNTTMSVATITGNPSGSDLNINAGSLFIGSREAVTVLGSIGFNLQNIASVGDLVALTSITINAANIDLILHKPGEILSNRGVLYPNEETHLIAGDPTLTGIITYSGTGNSAKILDLGISSKRFREFLFHAGMVLNFDVFFPPISGTISWVLRTDYWDTIPLLRELSFDQLLASRIYANLDSMPKLQPLWLSISRVQINPVDVMVAKYEAQKKMESAIISLSDFESYLNQSGSPAALDYISSIHTLIREIKQKASNQEPERYKTFLLVKSNKEIGTQSSPYLSEDVLEYTKPDSLTMTQWRQMVIKGGKALQTQENAMVPKDESEKVAETLDYQNEAI